MEFWFRKHNVHKSKKGSGGKLQSPDIKLLLKEENLNELGELYLSIPKIIQQSQENNVTFLKELSTMAVHGTLHLLGYNHEVLNEEKIMFSKTSKILENISLKE